MASAPLTIHPSNPPDIGDLLIVDHAEKIESDDQMNQLKGNPMFVSGLLLKPVLQPVIHRSTRNEITFAVPLALGPGQAAPPATLGLVSDGQVLATISLGALGIADATGRLFAVGRMPLEHVPAGKYQMQLTIGVGSNARIRTAGLTIVD